MDTLSRLEHAIAARQTADPTASYVASLLADGPHKPAKKLGEEAVEAALAAVAGPRDALCAEAADVLFHLLVVLRARGIPLAEVLAELERREGISGHAEKAARGS